MLNCPSCSSENLISKLEPLRNIHYGRIQCGDCGRFVKWLPKPKITDISITKLLQDSHLEEWERKFLKLVVYRTPTKSEDIVIEAIKLRIESVACGRSTG